MIKKKGHMGSHPTVPSTIYTHSYHILTMYTRSYHILTLNDVGWKIVTLF